MSDDILRGRVRERWPVATTRLERVHRDLFRVWSKDARIDETAKHLSFLALLHSKLSTGSTRFRHAWVASGSSLCQYLSRGRWSAGHRGSGLADQWRTQELLEIAAAVRNTYILIIEYYSMATEGTN